MGRLIDFAFGLFGKVTKSPSVGGGEPLIARSLCLEELVTSE